MKNQPSHIVLTTLLGILLVSAGIMTFNGLAEESLDMQHAKCLDLSESFGDNCESLLDTARFSESNCFQYTQYEQNICDEGKIKDSLSKTVVKISDAEGTFRPVEANSIKKMRANTSLNLMLETYTVSRKKDSCDVYIVTIESFTTTIERPNHPNHLLKPSAQLDFKTDQFDTEYLRRFLQSMRDEAFVLLQDTPKAKRL